jgi:4-diphosphocytidyl-2-C-methyl-D-erythritol kinase
MTALREFAWAKLNLTLRVLGRRADGFHELESLVAFAGIGDTLELEPQAALKLQVEGPFAGTLEGPNLILKAAEAAKAQQPGLALGCFRLVKVMPVAAGLGGGSADAAAALRLIARANDHAAFDSAALAPGLGSDVAVCLESAPALITGRGEIVNPVDNFPSCGVLLANPGVPLATAHVYAALEAAPLETPHRSPTFPGLADDFEMLVNYAAQRGNALEAVARKLVPEVADVLAALSALDGARLTRLSGSGPTCFALFATPLEAHRGAAALARAQPNWWIAASTLGNPAVETQ